MMAAFAAAEIIVILLRILLQVENKRGSKKNSPEHVRDSEFMNLTDKENVGLRVYHYYFCLSLVFDFKKILWRS
jgi:hypothetical protein